MRLLHKALGAAMILMGAQQVVSAYEDMPSPPLYSPPYSAQAITGKVVDARTGEPLSGVVIVAQWKIDRNFVGDDKALLKVQETVSDREGHYSFPAWGPVRLPPRADFRKGEDPSVAYFKAGYWPEWAKNDLVSDMQYRNPPLGGFKGNGQVVKLKKWDDSQIDKYESVLSGLAMSMPVENGATWRNFPRMSLEIEKVGAQVQRQTKSILGGVHVEGFSFRSLTEEDMELIRSLTAEE